MAKVEEHYATLLAEHYLWMVGVGFAEKVAEQKAILDAAIPEGLRRGPALDLGSGPGFQSVALAELGLSPVIAVDSSRELLATLEEHRGSHAIEAQLGDLGSLDLLDLPGEAAVAVCMGDTLTHLPSKAAVQKLFQDVHSRLARGGVFVLTYRDLTGELTGIDRFLPVRADEHRIMTCFLEYKDEEYVTVHDLILVRDGDTWELRKSSYDKLRLGAEWVAGALRDAGFVVDCSEAAGRMLLLTATRS